MSVVGNGDPMKARSSFILCCQKILLTLTMMGCRLKTIMIQWTKAGFPMSIAINFKSHFTGRKLSMVRTVMLHYIVKNLEARRYFV
jgi:hypothetical protein